MTPSSDAALGRRALGYLERVVRIDSASDDRSSTIPTTPGQAELADDVGAFFAGLGATVERDAFANVIATFPGVGRGADQRPVALMVHLDTARGTHPVASLQVSERWDGSAVAYPANAALQVNVANYEATKAFLGQDLVHGPGDAPFGLDDKLGLTHLMSLAQLFAEHPTAERPPLLLIGRPDEEVGRVEALLELAKTLAARQVDFGYTVDGIEPFEVNVENFNAASATVTIPAQPQPSAAGHEVTIELRGVNTHGATAQAEGHRNAVRFAVEILAALDAEGLGEAWRPARFETDAERECDGRLTIRLPKFDGAVEGRLTDACERVVDPHRGRGASFEVGEPRAAEGPTDGACAVALGLVRDFLNDDAVQPLLPEDSSGYDGYSNPNAVFAGGEGAVVHFRLRDFEGKGLAARKAQVVRMGGPLGAVAVAEQYENMAPRLADRPELVKWALAAGAKVGADCRVLPIRGGTGVDPFLDAGVPVANVGTGYFAPESEKEFTSLQLMGQHARWLFALMGEIVDGRA